MFSGRPGYTWGITPFCWTLNSKQNFVLLCNDAQRPDHSHQLYYRKIFWAYTPSIHFPYIIEETKLATQDQGKQGWKRKDWDWVFKEKANIILCAGIFLPPCLFTLNITELISSLKNSEIDQILTYFMFKWKYSIFYVLKRILKIEANID